LMFGKQSKVLWCERGGVEKHRLVARIGKVGGLKEKDVKKKKKKKVKKRR